ESMKTFKIAFGAILLYGTVAHAGDFVDTRLNFTITDESILAKPNETVPSVPGLRIGMPTSLGVLFFDNWDTRFSGYENLSHLTLYKNVERAHFQAEAALVLRLFEFT